LKQRLQPVDAEHPDTVALLAGPLVLMRILHGENSPALDRKTLLSARAVPHAEQTWRIDAQDAPIELRAFPDIGEQGYSSYQNVRPA
jgi:hypothetical protein